MYFLSADHEPRPVRSEINDFLFIGQDRRSHPKVKTRMLINWTVALFSFYESIRNPLPHFAY